MARRSAGEPASLETPKAEPLTVFARAGRLWRERGAERHSPAAPSPKAPAPDPAPTATGFEPRVHALEVRMAHLEAALEGLQDAVYRQAMLGDRRDEELRRRTEPHELARELGRDARKRGL